MPDDAAANKSADSEWVPINSSAIEAAMYVAARSELHIRFPGGRTYTYEGVPIGVLEGLIGASSPGAYFHSVIKPYGTTRA